MMERAYYVVDAFTNERYAGNAAAVVLDAEGLTDKDMAAIAAEFNLSETTFVLPAVEGASIRFRWFTPAVEVDLCGHATIGGVHALLESGRGESLIDEQGVISIETRSGVLRATVDKLPGGGRLIWLALPEPRLDPITLIPTELTEVLGLAEDALVLSPKPMKTCDGDLIVMVRDALALNEAKPDFAAMKKFCTRHRLRGLSAATTKTLTDSVDIQSRFFAPAAGVDEDPVTGSVHGPLASYVIEHGLTENRAGTPGPLAPMDGGRVMLSCVQGKPGGRAGLVRVLIDRTDPTHTTALIGGQAVTSMKGTLVS